MSSESAVIKLAEEAVHKNQQPKFLPNAARSP